MTDTFTLREVPEHFLYDVVDFSFSVVGLVSGIFCLYAVVSQRLYSKFLLVLIHTTALLIATLSQVFIWPALEYASHKNAACHGFKFLEYSARVLANNSSAAMMFWYMLFNKSMYFYNLDKGAVNLKKLIYESWIYFIGCTVIAGGTVILYFNKVTASTIIGRVYCFTIAFYGARSEDFLIKFCVNAPLYVPLGLGMVWFILGRSKWKLEASEILPGPTGDLIAVIHRLFYWLTWSAILTQFPVFIVLMFEPKYHALKVLGSFATHLTSIQNLVDAAAFYVILWKPTARPKLFQCLPETQTSASEIIVTSNNTTPGETPDGTSGEFIFKNTNDLNESLLV